MALFFQSRASPRSAGGTSCCAPAAWTFRFKDSASLTFTGLFASNFLPTTIGGDVVRLAGAMQMGFDRAVCLASIAADRLIGMAGMTHGCSAGSCPFVETCWRPCPPPSRLYAWLQRPLAFLKRTFSVFSLWLKKPGALLGSPGLHMGAHAVPVRFHLHLCGRPRVSRLLLGDRRACGA
ncbi:MAG: flippase-like domain-containing protein [Candidatus Moduliflexus flocculans]|nr:flippase-like domain-containing protein [Candidatus Moduliflexus flocculans]